MNIEVIPLQENLFEHRASTFLTAPGLSWSIFNLRTFTISGPAAAEEEKFRMEHADENCRQSDANMMIGVTMRKPPETQ